MNILGKKNDGFSLMPNTVKESGSRDSFSKYGDDRGHYGYFSFIKPTAKLLSDRELFKNKINFAAREAEEKANAIEEARNLEGNVYINNFLVPGIFQGFKISGGTFIERFDHTKFRDAFDIGLVEAGFQRDTNAFHLDRGRKPFSGSAEFILLDDNWSTAFDKAAEFMRIVTNYEETPEWKKATEAAEPALRRVFHIESYLIGANKPYNFSMIRITDFATDLPTGIESAIRTSFSFEQFALFKGEAEYLKPDTENLGANQAGDSMEVLENPTLVPVDPNIPT